MTFSSVKEVLRDFQEGKTVIIVDSEDRENEGDLVLAADKVTPEAINFMCTFGRGLICAPMEEERLNDLGIGLMVEKNNDMFGTAFTVSVDAKNGVTTGISAFDRAKTIKDLTNEKLSSKDFNTPGHIFPLVAKKGGVLKRAGHTEAAVDLARLAGLKPAGVICEIMNEDGSMARLPELEKFAAKHDLKMCSIVQLIEYRRKNEKIVQFMEETIIPTKYGDFRLCIYESLVDGIQHIALQYGEIKPDQSYLVRVHSECFTGDVLQSLRCDCGAQLDEAMRRISEEGAGVVLYLRQEGRGIGLLNKVRAYNLQDNGADTVEANEILGFEPDLREYGTGAQILEDLGLTKIRLMTNNPVKLVGLEGYSLEVIERVPIITGHCDYNRRYLMTKKTKMGHLI